MSGGSAWESGGLRWSIPGYHRGAVGSPFWVLFASDGVVGKRVEADGAAGVWGSRAVLGALGSCCRGCVPGVLRVVEGDRAARWSYGRPTDGL